jgi:hypothetical protein
MRVAWCASLILVGVTVHGMPSDKTARCIIGQVTVGGEPSSSSKGYLKQPPQVGL